MWSILILFLRPSRHRGCSFVHTGGPGKNELHDRNVIATSCIPSVVSVCLCTCAWIGDTLVSASVFESFLFLLSVYRKSLRYLEWSEDDCDWGLIAKKGCSVFGMCDRLFKRYDFREVWFWRNCIICWLM